MSEAESAGALEDPFSRAEDVFWTEVEELAAWTAGGIEAKGAEAWSVEGAATEAAGEAGTWLPWAAGVV
ncbi:hypothetical protein U1Q18_005272 [Sarracenia purpurea var. burkii]